MMGAAGDGSGGDGTGPGAVGTGRIGHLQPVCGGGLAPLAARAGACPRQKIRPGAMPGAVPLQTHPRQS